MIEEKYLNIAFQAIEKGFSYKQFSHIYKWKPKKDVLITISKIGIIVIDGYNEYEPQIHTYKWEDYGNTWALEKKDFKECANIVES